MKRKFEDNMSELKTITENLETGNLDLNEALKLYEKGMGIVKECEKELQDAESVIRIISKTNEKGGGNE